MTMARTEKPRTEKLSPRARRREANLARILDTAMESIVEGGFGALSMNKLAEAVDYTPGALYRYFDSKDALLSALVNRILEEVGERLAEAAAPVADNPLARVVALTQAYRAFSVEAPHKFGLLSMSLAEPRVLLQSPEAAGPVVGTFVSTLSPMADALRDAVEASLLEEGDPLERTLLVFTAVQGVLSLRKQARYAPQLLDVDRLSGLSVRTLLGAWGADAEALDAAFEKVDALGLTARSGGPS